MQIGAIGDASKVICTGDGLKVGTVGKVRLLPTLKFLIAYLFIKIINYWFFQDIRSFIDTRRAGKGQIITNVIYSIYTNWLLGSD